MADKQTRVDPMVASLRSAAERSAWYFRRAAALSASYIFPTVPISDRSDDVDNDAAEWSKAMPRKRMADVMGLTVRSLEDMHGDNLKRESFKRSRIRLDKLDSGDRAAIENSTAPKGKPRGRTKK